MKSVKTTNTGSEITVRKELFALGYRFRLHRKDLPGSPDIVFPTRKKAIFVNGCFWHGHGCAKGQAPKSRLEYWGPKIEATKERDERNLRELAGLGWQTYVLWACELKDIQSVRIRLRHFLGSPGNLIGKDVKRRYPEDIIE